MSFTRLQNPIQCYSSEWNSPSIDFSFTELRIIYLLLFLPAVFIVCQNIALVIYTGHTVFISVFGGEQFTGSMLALSASFSVFRVIVPQQTHHYIPCRTHSHTDVDQKVINIIPQLYSIRFYHKHNIPTALTKIIIIRDEKE